MLPHFLNAAAWACLYMWPFGELLVPSLLLLLLVHLVVPFWSTWRGSGVVSGPLTMFASDIAFLYAIWTQDCWGSLTEVLVLLFAGASLVALAYSVSVMALLKKRRS